MNILYQSRLTSPTIHLRLEMLRKATVFHIILFILSMISCEVNRDARGKKKADYEEKSLWKKEYEDELTEAMLSTKKRQNVTRVPQSPSMSDNDLVMEKLLETITSSEKYLKKVDSIDFRLNRLDIEVHEKTNSILKKLTEIGKRIREEGQADQQETILHVLKDDIAHIKSTLDKNTRKTVTVEGSAGKMDITALESQMMTVETLVRNVMSGVDAIVSTMSEVKNRQNSRSFPKKGELGVPVDSMNVISEFRKILQEQQRQKKCDCRSGRVDRAERYPTDCHEIQSQGFNISGIYKIKPDDMDAFYVLCDLTTAGGGWTVFQNRYDGSQDFFKDWSEYKYGFGNLAGEFWLGLEKLSSLTNQKLYELRVEVETRGQDAHAGYSVFTVGPEHEGYRISTLGTYYGTAGDSLSYHAGQKFSTPDADNDEWKDGSCASEHGGAWWYKECDKSNLNGKYATSGEENNGQSIYWISFKGPNYPLTKTKMMIRPLPASRPVDFGDTNRKLTEISRLKPVVEKQQHVRSKNVKGTYDLSRHHSPHHFEDAHADRFFPNYA